MVVMVTIGGFAATMWHARRADANAATARAFAADVLKEKNEQERLNDELRAQQDVQRRTIYAAHMNLIPAALERENVARALDLLESHRPRVGEPDLRGTILPGIRWGNQPGE